MNITKQMEAASLKDRIFTSQDLNTDELQSLAREIGDKLREDGDLCLNGESPSTLCLHAPRRGGSVDKKNRLAHLIAENLFPPKTENEVLWSTIRYGQLLSKISKTLRAELRKLEAERLALKQAPRVHMDKNAFCSLKARAISDMVKQPKPMPVQLTPLSEFTPFYDFLKTNAYPFASDPGLEKVEYHRGILYSDGRMDLCKQAVGPECITPLMEALTHNDHVKHFLLGNNLVGSTGAKAIADFISTNDTIRTWYLAGNCIDKSGVQMIATALQHNTVVESLWLKRNPIGATGAGSLADMLCFNTSLHTLDLDNCGLLDDGVDKLMDGLIGNLTVKNLYINCNGITSSGAKTIAEYFYRVSITNQEGLHSLYMSVNRIGDEGAKHLARGLSGNWGLKRLILSSNTIEADGGRALAEALERHPALQVFDLGVFASTADAGELPNRIEDSGADAIATLLLRNTSLKVVNVTHNALTEAGWRAVVMSAVHHPSLVHLDITERGLFKQPDLQKRLIEHLTANIARDYGCSRQVFTDSYLKFVRQPADVQYIESLYRTRDFQSRSSRKTIKKFWDAGDLTLSKINDGTTLPHVISQA